MRILLTLIYFLLASTVLLAQPVTNGEISGTVSSADGTLPWQLVLSLASTDSTGLTRIAEMQKNGSFRFTKVGKGPYQIKLMKAGGYVWSESTAQLLEERRWSAGDTVNLAIAKGGVITGTVTATSGQTVSGLRVQATPIGSTTAQPVTLFTDDRGIYRIYGLLPGKYVIGVIPKESGKAKIYFPSGPRNRATEIELNAGEERSGIDIQLFDLKAWSVSGKIVSSSSGKKSAKLRLMLAADEAEAASTYSTEQGGFIFTGMPSQDYVLIAEQLPEPGTLGTVSKPQKVMVHGADAEGLSVALAPLTSISGKVLIDNLPPTCQGIILPETLHFEAVHNNPTLPKEYTKALAQPDKTGMFQLVPLLLGEYTLQSSGPLFGYIKRITTQKVSYSYRQVLSSTKINDFSILVSYGGRVKLKGVSGSQAWLFNDTAQVAGQSLRDRKGDFNFGPVAPGKYSFITYATEIDESEAVKLFRTKQKPSKEVLIQACKVEIVNQP